LLFVMIFFPGFLNVIYFWIADSYLKADSEHAGAHEHDERGMEDKKEALMDGSDQDATEGKNYAGTPAWSTLETEKQRAGTMA
jgi:hypothetical protein